VKRVLFDHIAIALPRMTDAASFLCTELGGEPDAGQPSGAFTWGTYRFEGGGAIEIMEPRGPSGFLHRFLAERGPGIHHVTFKVPSLAEACARAEAAGYGIVGRDDSDPEWKEAFLHPKQALGIVVQLVEPGPPHSHSGSGLTLRHRLSGQPSSAGAQCRNVRPDPSCMTPPPGVAGAPPSVRVLGLRMRCQSVERAMTQWSAVLQGKAAKGPRGELVFSWPRSPMRLAVEIEPVQNEGPIAIELASGRPLPLPAGPHPVLGAVFTSEEA
jgi:catechol 2,3-dioxygenase-like lactoylglutathione lyase family enzyme